MQAYSISYSVKGREGTISTLIDAKNLKSAKKKLGHKHGYKDGRMINILKSNIIGYY